MDEREFCCSRQAMAFSQRQIVWSRDGDGSWNVCTGAFDNYALDDILFCPWCGERMPRDEGWQIGEEKP